MPALADVLPKEVKEPVWLIRITSYNVCYTKLLRKIAKKYGTIVSYDLNYRPSLWKAIGGEKKAQQVNREIAKYVDVMIGNEEDFTACLGLEVEGNDAHLKELDLSGYKSMINNAIKEFPNFKVIATTLRTVKSATINSWGAICYSDGKRNNFV